jgi:transposase
MHIHTLGIDIGKTSFHAVGLDAQGHVVLRQRCSRLQLGRLLAKLPPCRVGMEACGGAHHLGRQLIEYGHDVRLLPPQYVRPFVKTQKNDYADAEAIAEAANRPTIRPVPIKTDEQLDVQALHRVRSRLVGRRTAVITQLRGFLLERGLVTRTGRRHLERNWPSLLLEIEGRLTPRMRRIFEHLRAEWRWLNEAIDEATGDIEAIARTDAACQRLVTVPGLGALSATAVMAAIGNGGSFRTGRDFSAWLGLVPRQRTTGGKPTLLGITKRGNSHLRYMLIHGARSVYRLAHRDKHPFGPWLQALDARAHPNVVVVAIANKMARIAWAVLTRQEAFRRPVAVA